jgi:pantoate--beta-alanine ligase
LLRSTRILVRTVSSIADVRRLRRALREPVALVPTMGALHEGHLALIDAARTRAASVVVSVFVNPLQFAPTDDFAAYPRTLERDAELAWGRGVGLLFAPTVADMYPVVSRVTVVPSVREDGTALDRRWEGAARPGHFGGVLTVVSKLFHIVEPNLAFFGRKDLQQVTLVRALVQDLNFPLEVVTVPTVRADDGLALSSRNAYLSPIERSQALVIPAALEAMVRAWSDEGVAEPDVLEAIGRRVLGGEPLVAVEYLGLADPITLEPVRRVESGTVVMIAARVGRTRLIDNMIFEMGGAGVGGRGAGSPPSVGHTVR